MKSIISFFTRLSDEEERKTQATKFKKVAKVAKRRFIKLNLFNKVEKIVFKFLSIFGLGEFSKPMTCIVLAILVIQIIGFVPGVEKVVGFVLNLILKGSALLVILWLIKKALWFFNSCEAEAAEIDKQLYANTEESRNS